MTTTTPARRSRTAERSPRRGPVRLTLPRSLARSTARWDPTLLGAAAALSVFGCLLVTSAGGAEFGRRQFLSLLAALAAAAAVTRVEPRSLRAWAPALYLAATGVVLVAFSPLGVEIGGARAWIRLPGGFSVQPSEFAKIALILVLAAVLAGGRGQPEPDNRTVVQALGVAAVPIGIVLIANDTGSAMVIAGTVAAVLAVAGVSWRWLAGLAGAAAALAVLAVSAGLLADYQMRRLLAFLNPGADPTGSGLNTIQARIAIGSGGLTGQGLFDGSQTQGGFVPVNDSDFVFTVAGEETGFIGALAIIVLVGLVLWRGWAIARAAHDPFHRLVAVGVVAWFGVQSFENIGMTLGVTPVTGVTLPFVSYGGSSMVAAWVAVGLLQMVRSASMPRRR